MDNHHVTASPLCWPEGWQRTSEQQRSRFGTWKQRVTIAQASDNILHQLKLMGIPDYHVIISTDLRLRSDGLPYSKQREPEDNGASVWWKDEDEQRVIALDKYDRIADNLHAIGKTLEAMRGIERWGSGEILKRTFKGFLALPDPDSVTRSSWREILNYHGNDIHEANEAYKKMRSLKHPDKPGGSKDEFHLINKAWQMAEQELSSAS